jgi:hypothetical protein
VYAITSEPQSLADQAHEHWELSFDNIGDPHHEIPRVCDQRGWLTLYTNQGDQTFLQRGADWKVEHPKGFFQPGVLVLSSTSRVLYRWRSVPSEENLNGTVARPTPGYVWSCVEQALAADLVVDALLDENPEIDASPPPRWIFMAALIANGWFFGLKSFVYSPGVAPPPQRFAKAFKRWPVFIALWVVAFVALPGTLVSALAIAWVLWIGRDIRSTWKAMDVQVEIKSRH